MKSTVSIKTVYHRNSLLSDIMSDPDKAPIDQDLKKTFQESLGIDTSKESEDADLFADMLNDMPNQLFYKIDRVQR